jgi:hypothetical protein
MRRTERRVHYISHVAKGAFTTPWVLVVVATPDLFRGCGVRDPEGPVASGAEEVAR